MWHRVLLLVLALSPLGATTSWAESPGTVAVIGTGDLGDSLGPRFASLGYTVIYGSRDPESEHIAALVAETGTGASAALPADAAADADIVVLAIPWPAMETVARSLGDLDGKIVIDPSMPFKQGADGYPEHLFTTSSAEMIQDSRESRCPRGQDLGDHGLAYHRRSERGGRRGEHAGGVG